MPGPHPGGQSEGCRQALQAHAFSDYVHRQHGLWRAPEKFYDFLSRHLCVEVPHTALEWALLPELASALHGWDANLEQTRPRVYRVGAVLEEIWKLRLQGGLPDDWDVLQGRLQDAVEAHTQSSDIAQTSS